MVKTTKNFCNDCGMPFLYHIQTWLEELTSRFLPKISLPRRVEHFFDILIEKLLTFFRLASLRKDFTHSDIELRTTCFIEEARKRGVRFKGFRTRFGYANYFRAEIDGKVFRFEGLPIADFVSKYKVKFVDDKAKTKVRLRAKNFPVADGRAFWFWQRRKSIEFGVNNIGFPLVVKPRSGSLSRHVTTDIQTIKELKCAINRAVVFSPAFIIEKFLSNTFVHRATVVDFDFVACVKQVPANVVGNGYSTIRELIDEKNKDPLRGELHQKECTLYKIVENETTKNLLAGQGYNLSTAPQKDEIVYLQKDSFLKLGGDLVELTSIIHPDNLKLFRNVAQLFDIRIVGIDFLCQDVSISWKDQQYAVLELNSMPCIELHHFPSSGSPQNVAKRVVDLFFKYYV